MTDHVYAIATSRHPIGRGETLALPTCSCGWRGLPTPLSMLKTTEAILNRLRTPFREHHDKATS